MTTTYKELCGNRDHSLVEKLRQACLDYIEEHKNDEAANGVRALVLSSLDVVLIQAGDALQSDPGVHFSNHAQGRFFAATGMLEENPFKPDAEWFARANAQGKDEGACAGTCENCEDAECATLN